MNKNLLFFCKTQKLFKAGDSNKKHQHTVPVTKNHNDFDNVKLLLNPSDNIKNLVNAAIYFMKMDNTIIGTKNILKYRTFFLKGLAQKCPFAEKIVVYCIKIITKGKCSHLISEDGQNYHRKKKNFLKGLALNCLFAVKNWNKQFIYPTNKIHCLVQSF